VPPVPSPASANPDLRILHVTPFYDDAWAYGGIPRVVPRLCRGLAARGHRVTVLTTDACDQHRRLRWKHDQHAETGVTVEILPNLSNRAAYQQLFWPLGLRRFFAEHRAAFDVAHLHACRNLLTSGAARALKSAGVPYVVSPHGTAPRIERRLVAKALYDRFIDHHTLRDAARIVVVSDAERRQLVELGVSPAPLVIVENPLDGEELVSLPASGALRQKVPFDEILLFVGKITPRKRLDLLIEALAVMDRPRAGLVVIGNDMGGERAARALVRARGLEQRVVFLGLVAGAERLAAMRDADLLAYPSRDEVFGLVPFEALGCGIPVVVADDSGCGELVAQVGGGLVVRSGDIAALATALTQLLDDKPAWRAAAAEAHRILEDRFGRDRAAARLEAVYADAVREARP